MATDSSKLTRAEVVRRRRQQETRQHYNAVAETARSSVKPLVSRPRRANGLRPMRRGGGLQLLLPSGEAMVLDLDLMGALARIAGTWRMYSLTLIVLLGGLLVWMMMNRDMYVTSINLGGANLVPAEELFAESGLFGQHIFWVNPRAAEAAVAKVPGIATATVTVEWPARVTLVVVERVPRVMLMEGPKQWWVDAEGQKFLSRGDLPGLLPLVSEAGTELAAVPAEAIAGALQLKELRQNIEKLYFDPVRGLSYQDGRGWRGYFGTGTDMLQKLSIYERLVDELMKKDEHPVQISVENLKAPYYKK
jgi:cell division septal protein FtsQ